jgi:uncharacterized membrane protein
MDEKETGRVEAFSDGVFAVAITLLVLNIQPPPITNADAFRDGALRDSILAQWPVLLAFVTSFATVGIMWTNHHKVFSRVKYVDNNLLLLNLLLLLVVIFIPYPTALLAGQYKNYPSGHDAAILYTGTNVALSICFNLLWFYASHHSRLLREDADPEDTRAISQQYIFGPIVNTVIFILAWINVPISILLNLLLALFFALAGRSPQLSKVRKASSETVKAEDVV